MSATGRAPVKYGEATDARRREEGARMGVGSLRRSVSGARWHGSQTKAAVELEKWATSRAAAASKYGATFHVVALMLPL